MLLLGFRRKGRSVEIEVSGESSRRSTLLPVSVFLCMQLPVSAFWCMLLPVSAFWCMLLPVYAFWCMLLPVYAFRCMLLPVYAFRCMLLSQCFFVYVTAACNLVLDVGGAIDTM
jgi:hypothetical protein